jgi:nicotinate-nucleotide adenylyltransferase
MRVGLFFGSFNPIHVGHLVIGDYMVHFAGLDEVWFVVSPQNPFKEKETLLDEHHRLQMVRLACIDNPVLKACDVEFSMPRPSYTFDTLQRLTELYPFHEWIILMGSDTAAGLSGWKENERLLKDYDMYVYPRFGDRFEKPAPETRMTIFSDVPVMQVSATFIRSAISQDRPVRYLLPMRVEEYIRANALYR